MGLRRLASGAQRLLTGRPFLRSGTIQWEHLRFRFTAESPVFEKAQRRGIENGICRLVMATCGEGGVAIDVGMNYGFVSVIMAYATGPTGAVHSFEAVPHFCDVVAETLSDNRLNNVILHRKAAGAASGNAAMRLAAWNRPFPVEVVPLDEELRDLARLDLLKIDVDGPDFDVLLGARGLLERHHPTVVIEMTANEENIYALLRELGYVHFISTDNRRVIPTHWPGNLVASVRHIHIPERGALVKVFNE